MNSRIDVEIQVLKDQIQELREQLKLLEEDLQLLLEEQEAHELWIQQNILDNDYND